MADGSVNLFYTYLHLRADDGLVFYVGKGKNRRATDQHGRNVHWQRTKAKHGLRIEIVNQFATEVEAFESECMLIARYRTEGHPLCNRTDGGDGPSGFRHSEETRKKLSEGLKKRGLEWRQKVSAALKGRPRSEDARAKIRAGKTGVKQTAEHHAKIKDINVGRIRSPEFRAKVSAGITGRPVSQETREKISAAQRGRSVSQEMRDRISKTLTGRCLSDAEKERRRPLTHSAESRAKHSAAMKGRVWTEAQRAAVKGRPWTDARRAANNKGRP